MAYGKLKVGSSTFITTTGSLSAPYLAYNRKNSIYKVGLSTDTASAGDVCIRKGENVYKLVSTKLANLVIERSSDHYTVSLADGYTASNFGNKCILVSLTNDSSIPASDYAYPLASLPKSWTLTVDNVYLHVFSNSNSSTSTSSVSLSSTTPYTNYTGGTNSLAYLGYKKFTLVDGGLGECEIYVNLTTTSISSNPIYISTERTDSRTLICTGYDLNGNDFNVKEYVIAGTTSAGVNRLTGLLTIKDFLNGTPAQLDSNYDGIQSLIFGLPNSHVSSGSYATDDTEKVFTLNSMTNNTVIIL